MLSEKGAKISICVLSIAPRTCGILQPVKLQKLLIFAPVSKVVSGNLINSGDIQTSSEISLLTNLITVDFPIPNTFLIVWNEFPVESQSLFIDRVEIDIAHNVNID